MAKMIGVILVVLAFWQLTAAIRIRQIAKSEAPEDEKQMRIQRLNGASKIVQVTALIGVAIFIFMEV